MSKSKTAACQPEVVIICDEIDNYFSILNNNESHCLLRLVNVPVIFYTVLQLLRYKFRNFKIFCGAHKNKIEEFFRSINFDKFVGDKCHIKFINQKEINSVGDAIRFLDNENYEKDFILIKGDLVTDVNYENIMKNFEIQRKENPNKIFARVLSKNVPHDLTKYSKIIKYENSILYDPEIYICSDKVPSRMTEHYDCDTMDDLLDTVLSHADVIPDCIENIIVDNSCFRVRNLPTFQVVTDRLMRLQIDKMSPKHIFGDRSFVVSSDRLMFNTTTCYLHADFDRDCISTVNGNASRLIGNVSIGARVRIGRHCRLEDCVIGDDCEIGDCVIVRHSTILTGAKIGNNCTVSDSFVCGAATIGSNCVISGRSTVDHGYSVPCDTKSIDQAVFSEQELEFFWDEEVALNHHDDDNEELIDNCHSKIMENESVENQPELFQHEIDVLLKEAIDEAMSIDNLLIEADRLKHQFGLDVEDAAFRIVGAFVSFPIKHPNHVQINGNYRSNFAGLLSRYGRLLTRFCASAETAAGVNDFDYDSTAGAESCLEAVEEAACYSDSVMEKVLDIVYSLYDLDFVTETDIDHWFHHSALLTDPDLRQPTSQVRQNLDKLMRHFEEAEEESD